MKCDTLSPCVLGVLKHAGWSQSRKVTVDHWIAYYNNHQLAYSDEVIAFLENFGGLRVTPPKATTNAYYPEETVFDPIYAGQADLVNEWAEALNESFCPVGSIWNDRAVLVLSDDGNFYGISNLGIHHVGNDLASALEMLIAPTAAPELVHRVEG
jgi:hypothetical protein